MLKFARRFPHLTHGPRSRAGQVTPAQNLMPAQLITCSAITTERTAVFSFCEPRGKKMRIVGQQKCAKRDERHHLAHVSTATSPRVALSMRRAIGNDGVRSPRRKRDR